MVSPKERIKSAWGSMSSKVSDVVEKGKGKLKEKADTELGIYLHKNIGTLFFFDSTVRDYERRIIECARSGDKESAIRLSEEMKGYILYQMDHNRRFQKKLGDIADKLEEKKQEFMDKVEGLKGSKLVEKVREWNKQGEGLMEEE